MSVLVKADYVPSEEEPFMNERQKAYFRAKLMTWKSDILKEARETLEILQQENANHPDLADRASSETDRATQGARPPAQADRQDRLGAAPDRRWLLWFL
jgi:DnaK suppressor protein